MDVVVEVKGDLQGVVRFQGATIRTTAREGEGEEDDINPLCAPAKFRYI